MSPPMPVEHGSVMFMPAADYIVLDIIYYFFKSFFLLNKVGHGLTHCDRGILKLLLASRCGGVVAGYGEGEQDCQGILTAALPPARRISRPHCAASGCVHATMPSVLWTTLRREGNLVKSSIGARNTDELVRGIFARQAGELSTGNATSGTGQQQRLNKVALYAIFSGCTFRLHDEVGSGSKHWQTMG